MKNIPLIIGYGGVNAGGISSTDQSYRSMVANKLPQKEQEALRSSQFYLTATQEEKETGQTPDPQAIAERFFVRKITNPDIFDPQTTPFYRRDNKEAPFPVDFAACLPDGFRIADLYNSKHHPRGIQMAIFGANDCLNSAGISHQAIMDTVSPDRVSVYAGSGLGQIDDLSLGSVLSSIAGKKRIGSRQLPFGYPQMTADFINAYVLKSIGRTGNSCGACATFLYNLELAVSDIKNGISDIALVGTSEATVLPELIVAFHSMGAMISTALLGDIERRAASRPFGENKGFVMGEASQFVLLANPATANALGAQIHAAVPYVFTSSDGAKKSISSPGIGNYVTMAKAAAHAQALLGADKLKHSSYVHAHGSSTPQNRVTESKILSAVAKQFKLEQWPVVAIKSHLGHSQAAAAGDQVISALSYWKHGILPGIGTVPQLADDVETAGLKFCLDNEERGTDELDIGLINAKGFGGNNATAVFLSPKLAQEYYGKQLNGKQDRKLAATAEKRRQQHRADAEQGKFQICYEVGEDVLTDEDVQLSENEVRIRGYKPIKL